QTISATVGSLSRFAIFEELDTTPPTSVASVSPQPNTSGWGRVDETVDVRATDNPGGVGVSSIDYLATGAYNSDDTTVFGDVSTIAMSAEGITNIRHSATDYAGNVEAARTLTVKIDKTPPSPPSINVDRSSDYDATRGSDASDDWWK